MIIFQSEDTYNVGGLDFDLVCSLMSSLEGKDSEYRERQLRHKANILVQVEDGVKKESYIKANQLHYFNSSRQEFRKIGKLDKIILEKIKTIINDFSESDNLILNVENLA